MTSFSVDRKNFEGLSGTGSMISLISEEWLDKQFHTMKIQSFEKFLGRKTSDIKLRATNNIELDTEGIITFNFCISSLNYSFVVPFIVTKQELATPILGFNLIEHLVKEYPNLEVLKTILNSVFPNLNKAKTEAFVNLI